MAKKHFTFICTKNDQTQSTQPFLSARRFNNYLICSVELQTDCMMAVNGNLLKHFKTKLDNSVAIECKYGTRLQCV